MQYELAKVFKQICNLMNEMQPLKLVVNLLNQRRIQTMRMVTKQTNKYVQVYVVDKLISQEEIG